MSDNSLAVIPAGGQQPLLMPVMPLEAAIKRKQQILAFTAGVMVEKQDFGHVPGILKPMLFKAGAEKLCSYFGLRPSYEFIGRVEEWGGEGVEPLFSYTVKCRLYHIDSGLQVGEGDANCNSRETKYRWRRSDRLCPKCRQPTILRSKYPDKATGDKGWYCFGKKGGCSAQFASDDKEITDQQTGRVPNPDIADQINTLIKMAEKRALIAAVLIAVCVSALFSQDQEMEEFAAGPPAEQQQAAAAAEKTEARNNQAAEKTAARAAERPYEPGVMIQSISNLKEALKQVEPNPGAGEATYYDILKEGYGALHANSSVLLKDREKAVACWKELTRKVNEWKKAATLGVTAEDLEPESPETSDEIAERKIADMRRKSGEPALTVKDFDENELWLVKAYLTRRLGLGDDEIDPWLADFAGVKSEVLAQAESWREKQDDQPGPPTGGAASSEQGKMTW